MAERPSLKGWQCNVSIDQMMFDGVEISEVSNAGIIIKDDQGGEKFIPWSAIRVIMKTGAVAAASKPLIR